uniref:Phospholipase A2 n=1 Tax=Ixodes ricinus TaxID=34613 RepID=V5ICN5_IXORI
MRTCVLACLIVCGITRTLGLKEASNALGSLGSSASRDSAASSLNPINNGVKAWDNTFGKLKNTSSADIAKRFNDITILGVRRRVLTDVTQGDHRMVEMFLDTTNDTVLDCNIIGDKALIEVILKLIPNDFINKVTQEEMQYFLDLCENRNPTKNRLNSFFLGGRIDMGGPPVHKKERENSLFSNFPPSPKRKSGSAPEMFQSLFIFPGTKWCGAGDVAKNYDDLGVHRGTDMCCRAHDNSDDNIPALQTKHGITNRNLYTMTNCKDDRKFYNCLLNDGSPSSVAVGKLFFNVLRTECFANTYPKKCVKKNPIYIPLLTPKCKKYELDTSAPKEWQTFPPSDFIKEYNDRKRNQRSQALLTTAENDTKTKTKYAGVWVQSEELEDKPVHENENYLGNLVEGNDISPALSEEPLNNNSQDVKPTMTKGLLPLPELHGKANQTSQDLSS